MGIKEKITKVLDRDTSSARKIWMLFREQGITIISAFTAIGMAISILVEALLPGGGHVAAQHKVSGKPENVKEWLRTRLKALSSLLGSSGAKAAEALPCIIGRHQLGPQ